MYPYLFIIVQGKELNRKGKFNFNHIPDCNSPRGQAQKGKRNETHCARHTLIEFDAASYSYTGGELLSEMSLTITPGAFYFITGPSGSGKTTFLKMCYGALLPNSGGLQIFGRDVRELTRDDIALIRRNIGVIHQDLISNFQNLHFPGRDDTLKHPRSQRIPPKATSNTK